MTFTLNAEVAAILAVAIERRSRVIALTRRDASAPDVGT